MKSYDVKYEIGDEVYVLLNRKIFKTKIQKIKIIDGLPYGKFENGKVIESDGRAISYFVISKIEGNATIYDWYDQEDVFQNKQELVRKLFNYHNNE